MLMNTRVPETQGLHRQEYLVLLSLSPRPAEASGKRKKVAGNRSGLALPNLTLSHYW